MPTGVYERVKKNPGAESSDEEAIPTMGSDGEVAPPKRKYTKKAKVKEQEETKPEKVDPRLIAQVADSLLLGASGIYESQRGAPLRYDPAKKETFVVLLGRWAEESGMMLPLWLQVAIAGGACIVPAIIAAEAERKTGRPSDAGRNGRIIRFTAPDAGGFRPDGGPPSPLRPTVAGDDLREAGIGENLVDSALGAEPGTPPSSP